MIASRLSLRTRPALPYRHPERSEGSKEKDRREPSLGSLARLRMTIALGLCPAPRRAGCTGIKAGYGAPTLMKMRQILFLLFPALLMSATAQAKSASKNEFITLGGGCF